MRFVQGFITGAAATAVAVTAALVAAAKALEDEYVKRETDRIDAEWRNWAP